MENCRHFVVFKSEDQYSITECSNSGVKHMFIRKGMVSGDESVLQELSGMMPADETLNSFIERKAGHLIYDYRG